MQDLHKPGLFGLKHSNRDFELKETWGKNQFNSSFPAALSAYLCHKGFENIYLTLDENLKVVHKTISTSDVFGILPTSDNLFYAFESTFSPYQQLVIGHLPRVDLVTQERNTGKCLKGIEIKLTALPDHTTCEFLSEEKYGTEIVIRPDTIVYLACSIANHYKNEPKRLQNWIDSSFDDIKDWTEADNVLPFIPIMIAAIDKIALDLLAVQEPIIMQPIWKTEGKSPRLSEYCLDVFMWSNLAFIQLFIDVAREEVKGNKITRQVRTIIWLFKMLYDFSRNGQINHTKIIDELSFNTKNDKAFAVSGRITQPYMTCNELTKPRISKAQIKEIIVGGGQNLLSPERRFDAIIFNSPELFTF
jgi:HindVP restriction endonuclease